MQARETPRDGELNRLPIIVYGDAAPANGDPAWRRLAGLCSVRRVRSPERLLDRRRFPPPRRRQAAREAELLEDLHQSDKILAGKKVLIVDDDMRNIFALSTVLEEHDMDIVSRGQRPRRDRSCSDRRTWTSC